MMMVMTVMAGALHLIPRLRETVLEVKSFICSQGAAKQRMERCEQACELRRERL